jgi:ubiquinone/menaquinone biosynthesis C-methylase UbiE
MKIYSKDINSVKYWNSEAKGYDSKMTNNYHIHRLAVIRKLYQSIDFKNKNCLDFGCGNGVTLIELLEKGSYCLGLDISKQMIGLAKNVLKKKGFDPGLVSVGGVNQMKKFVSESFDVITSFNVLAYLNDKEIDQFYRETYRLLKKGGQLVVTHSNELFDMYSLNSYTIEFFAKYFYDGDKKAIKKLLYNNKTPEIITFNVRPNPLNYKYELMRYGFVEEQQEFYNQHKRAPSLLQGEKEYSDTLNYFEEDRWKLMFTCSAFGSRSVKK